MDFLSEYMRFTEATESPRQYHLWSAISIVSAQLSRNIFLPFGHENIYPNMYVLLVGAPATRKSTAVKISKKLLSSAGYRMFSQSKSSREKFLLDMEEGMDQIMFYEKGKKEMDLLAVLSDQLDGLSQLDTPISDTSLSGMQHKSTDAYCSLEEFCDFVGQNNMAFFTTLTNIYDPHDRYSERLKNSKSVSINLPCVGILGAATPHHFTTHMPIDIIGTGFLSRGILVFGEPTGIRITIPPPQDEKLSTQLRDHLKKIGKLSGQVGMTESAFKLLDEIYHQFENLRDTRFQYYCARRLTHLLKLCVTLCGMKLKTIITPEIVVEAQTILTYTEISMSDSLGDFGAGKNSGVIHKIVETLRAAPLQTLKASELMNAIQTEIDSHRQFHDALSYMMQTARIQTSKEHVQLIPRNPPNMELHTDFEKYLPWIKVVIPKTSKGKK